MAVEQKIGGTQIKDGGQGFRGVMWDILVLYLHFGGDRDLSDVSIKILVRSRY